MRLGLSTVFLDKYMISKRLGEGGFGTVYLIHRISDPRIRLALKTEPKKPDPNEEYLKLECKILTKLAEAKAQHSIRLMATGETDTHWYLVMDLVGPSLHDLRRRMPAGKFSSLTCGICYVQCLDAIRELHQIGFIHRDVKPMNFAVGRMNGPTRRWLYLLDFGLCRQIMFDRSHKSKKYTKTGNTRLRQPRKQTKLIGTLRYCSLNSHRKEELGRHDDLWSLWFMLAEMFLGELPWRNKDKAATERLKEENLDELAQKLPEDLGRRVVKHLRILGYSEEPNYSHLRALGASFLYSLPDFSSKSPLDWEPGAKDGLLFAQMHSATPVNSKISEPPRLAIEAPDKSSIVVKSMETVHMGPVDSGNSDIDDTMEGIENLPKDAHELNACYSRKSRRAAPTPVSGQTGDNRRKPNKPPTKGTVRKK